MPTPNDMARKGIMSPNEARKMLGLKALATDDRVRTKAMATIEQAEDDTQYGPHGGFTAVLSSPRLDRDGDIWPQSEWITPLPERITIDADHGMSVATTVGSAVPYFDNAGQLLITASFSSIPRAQEVRTLIREGHVSSVSVAALTDNSKKSGTQKRELLNAGVVAIPANPDAKILDAKSETGGITVKVTPVLDTEALRLVLSTIKAATPGGGSDHALLQAIHDASVHMGANCAECMQCAANEMAQDQATGASDGANTKSVDTDLLEPVDTADDEEKSFTFTLDEFKAAMQEVLNPPAEVSAEATTESPAEITEAPVDETAAATEEVPAPVEEAAAEVVETAEDVDPGTRADHMLMALYAAQYN